MKRHPFDLTSLLFGLVFAGAAAAYLAADQLERAIDARWVLPTALIALGAASIAGAVGGLRANRAAEQLPPDQSADDELQPAGGDRREP